jgi:hypothetical protein
VAPLAALSVQLPSVYCQQKVGSIILSLSVTRLNTIMKLLLLCIAIIVCLSTLPINVHSSPLPSASCCSTDTKIKCAAKIVLCAAKCLVKDSPATPAENNKLQAESMKFNPVACAECFGDSWESCCGCIDHGKIVCKCKSAQISQN